MIWCQSSRFVRTISKNNCQLFKDYYSYNRNVRTNLAKIIAFTFTKNRKSLKEIKQQQAMNHKKSLINIEKELLQYSTLLSTKFQDKSKSETDKKLEQFYKMFVELTENSFEQYIKNNYETLKLLTPSEKLMLTTTIQSRQLINIFLSQIYPQINYLSSSELISMLQKLIAYKPIKLPNIPMPRPLDGCEEILVLLGTLYNGKDLIGWLQQVPVYIPKAHSEVVEQQEQKQLQSKLYFLFLGALTILQSIKLKPNHNPELKKLQNKCLQRLQQIAFDHVYEQELFASLILIAFDTKFNQFAINMLLQWNKADPQLLSKDSSLQQLDVYKISLLFIAISQKQQLLIKMSPEIYSIAEVNLIRRIRKRIFIKLYKEDWKQFVKLHILTKFWQILDIHISVNKINQQYEQFEQVGDEQQEILLTIDKIWPAYQQKLINHTFEISSSKIFMNNMSTEDLLKILCTIEKLKIDNEKLLRNLLMIMATRIQQQFKPIDFIKLGRVLVTYVRQFEDYLLQFHDIVQKKKSIFNQKQINELNRIFDRVRILFPNQIRSN